MCDMNCEKVLTMELILAILGIGLTVLLSGPVITWVSKVFRERRSRERWSADLQVEEGVINRRDNYAFEFWNERIEVDDEGTAQHEIDARIVNLGQHLLESADFPVYCDGSDISEAAIQPWARAGRTNLRAELRDWVPERARGRVRISFSPAIAPAGRCRFHWGFRMPDTFRAGDEYYNWDVSSPHYEIGGEIVFGDAWSVLYARFSDPLSTTQHEPVVGNRTIRWKVKFPKTEERLVLEFGLHKNDV